MPKGEFDERRKQWQPRALEEDNKGDYSEPTWLIRAGIRCPLSYAGMNTEGDTGFQQAQATSWAIRRGHPSATQLAVQRTAPSNW